MRRGYNLVKLLLKVCSSDDPRGGIFRGDFTLTNVPNSKY